MTFPRTSHVYKVVGACRIQADVYRAPGQGLRPAILWLHGGALIFGDRSGLAREQRERYLDAGYTVVAADYRLAPETPLPAIIDDLQAACAWVREAGPGLLQIDPERLAVIGHSAGGYLTLMAGFRVQPRPRVLVAFYGYGDITAPWYSRPDPHYSQQPLVPEEEARRAVGDSELSEGPANPRFRFYLYCRQRGLWPREVAGHDPDREPDWFDPFCPLRNVTAKYPATMLIHGQEDTDVPYEQSVLMARELRRLGVAHVFLGLTGCGHGFDHQGEGMRDPVVAGVFDQVLAFLREQGMGGAGR